MLRSLATGVFILVLCACGDSETDAENKANLIGNWQSQCVMDMDDSEHGGGTLRRLQQSEHNYRQEEALFTETTLTWSMSESSDAACESKDMVIAISGAYKAGQDASSPTDVEGATSIDLTAESVTMTINSQDMVTFMNSMNFCTSALEVGVAMDVANCPSMGDMPTTGDVWKTAFMATADSLKFANGGDSDDQAASAACRDASGREICFEDSMEMTRK